MNTKTLMLGIFLLAGLSFAYTPPLCDWAETLTDRYLCGVVNAYDGNYGDVTDYGYYTLAVYLADGDSDYDTYLENMYGYLGSNRLVPSTMRNGVYNMRQNPCVEAEVAYIPTEFRAGMVEYNTYAVLFKKEFASFLKLYMLNNPDSETKSEVFGYLSDINADYRYCISPPVGEVTLAP